MPYSSLYDSQAREKYGIDSYQELAAALRTAQHKTPHDIYVIAMPVRSTARFVGVIDIVRMGACIDLIVEGRSTAQRIARKAKAVHAGITRYVQQGIAKLQAELDTAKENAHRKNRPYCFYRPPRLC